MTQNPTDPLHGLYGSPPVDLALPEPGAVQLSPLHPGAQALEALADGALQSMLMLAPPGTVERRYAVAHALRALAPGAPLVLLAPKDRGGSRLRKELEVFGCTVDEDSRRHHRICHTTGPGSPDVVAQAIAEGAPRFEEALGLWTQPGVFSWDRIDPGSALLLKHLPPLAGDGADLGSGLGLLAKAALASPKVKSLALVEHDRRAVEASRRNVEDSRAQIHWANALGDDPVLEGLDFVVMNPPFHDAGSEDKGLGQRFIQRAHQILRRSGTLWLVANRHLPYEPILAPLFPRVERRADAGGYKVFEARK
jgi:16S rRNA (guanine1207-N2)-methyltransferase